MGPQWRKGHHSYRKSKIRIVMFRGVGIRSACFSQVQSGVCFSVSTIPVALNAIRASSTSQCTGYKEKFAAGCQKLEKRKFKAARNCFECAKQALSKTTKNQPKIDNIDWWIDFTNKNAQGKK